MDEIRIDKWLWAARCFKTRSLASTACSAGHVKVGGQSVKPAKTVRAGDRVEVRKRDEVRVLEVVEISDRRGPAKVAQTLYVDHSPPRPPKDPERLATERGAGRPNKRDRRALRRLRGR